MNITRLILTSVVATSIMLTGCSRSDDPAQASDEVTRSFLMGFTPWPYEATLEAQSVTYERLNMHGDIIKHHLQGGIPWPEALAEAPYHANVESDIQGRLSNTGDDKKILLAINALNAERNGLAGYWSENTNQALPEPWDSKSWRDEDVISAYLNYALDMISRFDPAYFEFGTEASELLLNRPDQFDDYVIFAEAVYEGIKAEHPTLPLLSSVALKSPNSEEMQTILESYSELMPYTDILGVSVYPYVFFNHDDKGNPDNLPSTWLNQIQSIAGLKPIAISETGWIGEDLNIPAFSIDVSSNESGQAKYLQALLTQAEELNAKFIIWWTVSDFDTLWSETLSEDPLAKIWRDIGLYDGVHNMREALSVWDAYYSRPYIE